MTSGDFEINAPSWVLVIGSVCCIIGGGLAAGLTIGLMSLDKMGLEVLIRGGNQRDAGYAKKILPIREKGNLLLCTLLLANTAFNELLPLLIDRLPGSSPLVAFFVPIVTVMLFGEIIPQSICTRYGLAVGAHLIYVVKFLRLVFLPIAWPLAWILDRILGEELGINYSHKELAGLIELQSKNKYGELTETETTILKGTLDFARKTVADVLTPIDRVFMLDVNEKFDTETINKVWQDGHSRIPIYENNRTNILGLIFSKDLITLRSEDELSVRTVLSFYGRPILRVFSDTKLESLLVEFKSGRTHIALVQTVNNEGAGDPFYEVLGIVTLEDVIEELIQIEILDENDLTTNKSNSASRDNLSSLNDSTMSITPSGFEASLASSQNSTLSYTLSLGGSQLKTDEKRRLNISMFHNHQFGPLGHPQRLMVEQIRAIVSYLSKVVKEFRAHIISEEALFKLISQRCTAIEIKPDSGDEGYVYRRSVEASFFTLVLSGKLEVLVGQEGVRSELGPWSFLGVPVLQNSRYVPDLTARAIQPSLIATITGADYKSALHPSFIQPVLRTALKNNPRIVPQSHPTSLDMEMNTIPKNNINTSLNHNMAYNPNTNYNNANTSYNSTNTTYSSNSSSNTLNNFNNTVHNSNSNSNSNSNTNFTNNNNNNNNNYNNNITHSNSYNNTPTTPTTNFNSLSPYNTSTHPDENTTLTITSTTPSNTNTNIHPTLSHSITYKQPNITNNEDTHEHEHDSFHSEENSYHDSAIHPDEPLIPLTSKSEAILSHKSYEEEIELDDVPLVEKGK